MILKCMVAGCKVILLSDQGCEDVAVQIDRCICVITKKWSIMVFVISLNPRVYKIKRPLPLSMLRV